MTTLAESMQKLLAQRGLLPLASTRPASPPAIDISGMDEMSRSMRKVLPAHLRAAYDQNWVRSTLALRRPDLTSELATAENIAACMRAAQPQTSPSVATTPAPQQRATASKPPAIIPQSPMPKSHDAIAAAFDPNWAAKIGRDISEEVAKIRPLPQECAAAEASAFRLNGPGFGLAGIRAAAV